MTVTTLPAGPSTAALIAAGAVVPGAVEPGDDRDTVTARHYAHPALDDRVVVRLVPAVLGVAEDLTCEYLGFSTPTATEPVGTGRRSALGFPAWALVNDPANGHHALNLVKDVERLARTAKSRAGAAKDGFTALGDMLGRSAPHFLPTFYEQAGRIFLEHGNNTYAATMFGKAREAEEVHDLAVDPDRLREVFLEFAFAGALTAKALSAHAKGMARRHDPDAAYELFLTLCVERTRGGLPPYTGMPEDLRKLARAAMRDLAVEDERLLRAVLDTSAIDGANAAFWKYYRDAVVGLAGRDEQVRDQLLRFVPSAVGALDTWLEILTASGATRALTEPATGEPGAVSPAAWLSSVCRVRAGGWRATTRSQRLLELVAAMAERLAADGEPVHALRGWRQHELDLVDLLLTHAVPVATDRDELQFDVDDWLPDEQPGRRDLAALGSTEPYAAALGDSVVRYLRSSAGDAVADRETLVTVLAVPGLRTALARWLTVRAGEARPTGLPGLTERLRDLSVVRLAEAFADVPEAAEAIAATDVAGALHTTLRTGLLDELGWPALEATATRLRQGGKKDEPVVLSGEGWPAIVLGRGESFVVVGPDGVLAEHVSRIPPDARQAWMFTPQVSWFDGVLLVRWQGPGGDLAYWSDAPSTVFTPAGGSSPYFHRGAGKPSIALGDGARFGGHRAVRPGDRHVTTGGAAFGDGTTLWTTAYRSPAWRWVEVDPATGEHGRASLPAFLEDFAADGAELTLMVCTLRPAVDATADSPLGIAGGLHGWRVRKQADGTWLAEGVDGRRVRLPSDAPTPTGLLRLPGGGELVLSEAHNQVLLLDGNGDRLAEVPSATAHPAYAAGTPFVAPRGWWHLLRPRDEAGSAALRQVSRAAVDAMVAAATEELDRDRQDPAERYAALVRGERDALATAVTESLPGLTHPALIAGVVDLAVRTAELLRGYRAFGAVAGAARTVDLRALAPTGPVVTEYQLSTALSWFTSPNRYYHGSGTSPVPALLTALAEAAAQVPVRGQALPATTTRWYGVLPRLASVAYRAAHPLTPDEEREALVVLLRAVADSGLADDGLVDDGHWRVVTALAPEHSEDHTNCLVPTPDGFLALFQKSWYGPAHQPYNGLQYTATAGRFALPRDWQLSDSTDLAQPFGRDRIARFLDVLADRGPVPWRPEAVPALVELTGLGTAEATLLLAGMPRVDDWGATYLDTRQRKLLGLSAAEAKAAKQRMNSLDEVFRHTLLAAAVPADPADLWAGGPDVAAVAAAWTAVHGVRQPVPDDVLVDAARQLPLNGAVDYVTGVVNPDTTPWLTEDADLRFTGAELTGSAEGAFSTATLQALPGVLLWLAQRLPVGSPLRARLPEALALARQRVAHPGFAVNLGNWNEAKAISRLLGVDPPAEGTVVDHRPWLHLVGNHNSEYCGVVVRPGLVGPQDRPLLTALAELTGDRWLPVALDTLADDGVAAACGATAPEGADPAAAPQHPAVTVPHLVREAAARLGLDEDAAVLYLQLLALPAPTDANVARWTGWQPARLRAARTALAATDLVLTAKRARAGRSLFLPGGWLTLNRPHLPLESWKAPLYGITDTPTDVVVPREPVATLFARAWQRVLDGDTPAYEQLRTGGRR